MKQLFQKIYDLNGVSFYTGYALFKQLIGKPEIFKEIMVYGVSEEDFIEICRTLKLAYDPVSRVLHDTEEYRFTFFADSKQFFTARNDFSINCIYVDTLTNILHDPFNGLSDIKNKQIRADKFVFLNQPEKMIEACRLAAEYGFTINVETWFHMYLNAIIIKHIDPSLIRSEIARILMLGTPSKAFDLMRETRLLEYILPELSDCATVIQNRRVGVRNVFEHIMYALDACEMDLDLRLVILFHDIAKPQTLELREDGKIHFFNHEVIGAKLAKQYMKHWGFSRDQISKVSRLILYHMFDADPKMTDRAIRRLIKKVGKDLIYDLLKVREADRSGAPEPLSMKKIKNLRKKVDKELNAS